MKLLVGLGNPGKKYSNTRHNAGFMAIEGLREKLAFDSFKLEKSFEAVISEGVHGGEKVLLVMPQTFMNVSGTSVQKIASFYNIPLKDIFVVYDDLDLPLGTIRIRQNGSAGTHNGMKSLITMLSSGEFGRVRIGIESRGVSAHEDQDTSDFVLGRFSKEELAIFKPSLERAVEGLVDILEEGIEAAMNKYN